MIILMYTTLINSIRSLRAFVSAMTYFWASLLHAQIIIIAWCKWTDWMHVMYNVTTDCLTYVPSIGIMDLICYVLIEDVM